MASLTIFCDFDGTITEVDTCEIILDKFSPEDWRKEDKLFLEGKITLEECLQRQLAPVKATHDQMITAVDYIRVRPGFKNLVEYSEENKIELVIVSAGLDFIIKKKLEGINGKLRIISPESKLTPNGLTVKFPRINSEGEDFKVKLINLAKSKGQRVFYIGDGESDFAAATRAGFIFAVEGSRLAHFCKERNLAFKEFRDFTEIVSSLKEIEVRS